MSKLLSLILLLLFCQLATAQEGAVAAPAKPAVSAKAALREPALAVVGKALREMRETRLTTQRLSNQWKMAALLWPHDEKQARALFTETAANWQTLLEQMESSKAEPFNEGESSPLQELLRLRYEIAENWGEYDGAATLRFLRATRPLVQPYNSGNPQADEAESQMVELQVSQKMLRRDPKLALKTVQASIAKGEINAGHIAFLNQLKASDPAAASELARAIYGRLDAAAASKSHNAGYVAFQFLQYAHEALTAKGTAAAPPVSETEIRALVEILSKFALSISPEQLTLNNNYGSDYGNVQGTLSFLSQWDGLEKYAPGRQAELKARLADWQKFFQRGNPMQEYYEVIRTQPIAAATEKISQAPVAYRSMLYQYLANRATSEGNFDQARQLINEHITNPSERAAALSYVERATLEKTIGQDNLEASRAGIARLSSRAERLELLLQLAQQANEKGKKDVALKLLEEARQQLAPRPANQEQASSYFTLAAVYAEIAPARAFEIIETLTDQFNELCVAAERVDGFIGQTYDNGEFLMEGSLGYFAQRFPEVLAILAEKDFARTEKALSRFQRREVRVVAALAIGQTILSAEEKSSGTTNGPAAASVIEVRRH